MPVFETIFMVKPMGVRKSEGINVVFQLKEQTMFFDFCSPYVNNGISNLSQVATSRSSTKRIYMVDIKCIFELYDEK
ncbi:hypothetical protein C0993_007340, partial [Termitomyces sp. T159_Od127]